MNSFDQFGGSDIERWVVDHNIIGCGLLAKGVGDLFGIALFDRNLQP